MLYRVLLLVALVASAAGFTVPTNTDHVVGRRAVAGALTSALFLGANAANAAQAPIRKANQELIGVSSVPIPSKGEGNKGAGMKAVKIDTSGWKATAVIDPEGNGAKSGLVTMNFKGGESDAEKAAAMKKEGKLGVSSFKRPPAAGFAAWWE